jgi:hypothetical protein
VVEGRTRGRQRWVVGERDLSVRKRWGGGFGAVSVGAISWLRLDLLEKLRRGLRGGVEAMMRRCVSDDMTSLE